MHRICFMLSHHVQPYGQGFSHAVASLRTIKSIVYRQAQTSHQVLPKQTIRKRYKLNHNTKATSTTKQLTLPINTPCRATVHRHNLQDPAIFPQIAKAFRGSNYRGLFSRIFPGLELPPVRREDGRSLGHPAMTWVSLPFSRRKRWRVELRTSPRPGRSPSPVGNPKWNWQMANGNKDENLRSPGGLILTHTHLNTAPTTVNWRLALAPD